MKSKAINIFRSEVRLTDNRTAIICLRAYGKHRYVQIRTYNRQKTEGFWYPTKRSYTVPLDHAEELGKAIIAASKREMFGSRPDWWTEFERQYAGLSKRQIDASPRDCSTQPLETPAE